MQQVTKNSLGFTIPVLLYASCQEINDAAGNSDAALSEANDNLFYRGGTADDARDLVANAVSEVLEIERPYRVCTRTNDKGEKIPITRNGEQVTEYTQSESAFVEYALGQAGKTVADIEKEVLAILEKTPIAVDVRLKERAPKQPKLTKKWLEVGTRVIQANRVEQVAKDFEEAGLGTLTGSATPASVGAAVKAITEWKLKQQEEAYATAAA